MRPPTRSPRPSEAIEDAAAEEPWPRSRPRSLAAEEPSPSEPRPRSRAPRRPSAEERVAEARSSPSGGSGRRAVEEAVAEAVADEPSRPPRSRRPPRRRSPRSCRGRRRGAAAEEPPPRAAAEEPPSSRGRRRSRGRPPSRAAPAPQSGPKPKRKRLPRALRPQEDASDAREGDRAQADRPAREARARARPEPGAARHGRLRRDGQDDRRQGRRDQVAPEVQEGRPPVGQVPRPRRGQHARSATSSASSRRGRCRRPSAGG